MLTVAKGMQAEASNPDETIGQDRRQHRRVPIQLLGRYMLPDKSEFPCQVRNISAGGMAISCPASGQLGDRLIAYIDDIGRVEGVITRTEEYGAAVQFTISSARRERIVERLTWILSSKQMDVPEGRREARYAPANPECRFVLPDGRSYECEVIDISMSGASIKVDVVPGIGTPVRLGRMNGTVARIHDTGIAIEFDDMPDPGTLADHFS